ncbi:MAG: diphosphate--fructose-6-phosphate 1-phosphotransferase [Pseudomonadales bacterium]|nr:diphosphate--fructose-6-phosphate 1-phosphotransferase [Pseudomonadales bacterium]
MAEELTGNVLITQCGMPTPTSNASLAGIVSEALNHDCIEEIYGSLNGLQGILSESLIDLAEESQQTIRALRYTPAAVLGTSSGKLSPQDLETVLTVFAAHNIRYFLCIGDIEAQSAADQIARFAQDQQYDVRVIGIPSAADNNLPITDHCPGFASTVKHLSNLVRELACQQISLGERAMVSILEVAGTQNSWLSASTIMAKTRNNPDDAPHIVCLADKPFAPEVFLQRVQETVQKHGTCTIVVDQNLTDMDGNYLTASESDAPEAGAPLMSTGQYVALLIKENLGVKAEWVRPGMTQFTGAHHLSGVDCDEAYTSGQVAIEKAIAGENAKMVTLTRGETEQYSCEYKLVPFAQITAGNKPFPQNWINEDGHTLSYQLCKYLQPLIQGDVAIPTENNLQRFAKLNKKRVERKASHATA